MLSELKENNWIWFVGYFVIVAIITLISLVSRYFSLLLLQWGEIVGIFVTGFLTLGLIVLYDSQRRLQQVQYEPVPWLEGHFTEKGGYGEDNLHLLLSNVGEGTAVNLRTRTDVDVLQDTPDKFSISPVISDLMHVPSDIDEELDIIPSEKSHLYPDTIGEKFRVSDLVQLNFDDESIQRTLRALPKYIEGLDTIRVKIDLIYDDKLGYTNEKRVIDEVWPVNEEFSVNRMMVDAVTYKEYLENGSSLPDTVSSRRMLAANKETLLETGTPLANLFFAGRLDEDRITVHTSSEQGFSFGIEPDDDYKEELKEEYGAEILPEMEESDEEI